jgi:hypothetical protein
MAYPTAFQKWSRLIADDVDNSSPEWACGKVQVVAGEWLLAPWTFGDCRELGSWSCWCNCGRLRGEAIVVPRTLIVRSCGHGCGPVEW